MAVNSPADFTFTVGSIGSHPGFSFTVNLTNPPSGFITESISGAGCTNCFRTGTVTSNPAGAGPVTLTYVDLTAAGLTYSTLGVWSKPTSTAGSTVGGAFAFGVVTRGQDLPTSLTATYTGPMIGRYAGLADGTSAPAVYTVGATATAQADFGARRVTFSTSNSMRTPEGSSGAAVSDPRLNLSGVMTYAAGVNSLSSTNPGGINASSQAGVGSYNMSGEVKGGFFGPPATTSPFAPPELSGAVAVTNGQAGTANQTMVGGFALKR